MTKIERMINEHRAIMMAADRLISSKPKLILQNGNAIIEISKTGALCVKEYLLNADEARWLATTILDLLSEA